MAPPPKQRRKGAAEADQAGVAAAVIERDSQGALALPNNITVKELSDLVGTSPVEVIKELMKNGVMATINQLIDYDTAAIVATDLGYSVEEAGFGPDRFRGATHP